MSVYKRKNSSNFYVELTVPGTRKRVIRSSKTANKGMARRFEHTLRDAMYRQQYLGEVPAITFSEAISYYEDYQTSRVNPRNLAAQVAALKAQLARVTSLNHDLHTLSTQNLVHLVHLRKQEGVSDGTINLLLISIRSLIKLCAGQYMVPAKLTFPKVKVSNARTRVMTGVEQSRLLAELKPKAGESSDNYDLVVLLLATGARLNEIQQLEWSQVDLGEGMVSIYRGKTGTTSQLRLTKAAREVLQARKLMAHDDVLVFPSQKGSKRTCTPKAIQNAYKRVGMDGFCTHMIRHTVASRLINNGMSLFEVSKVLGHSSISTTTRYSHLEQRVVADKAATILES